MIKYFCNLLKRKRYVAVNVERVSRDNIRAKTRQIRAELGLPDDDALRR